MPAHVVFLGLGTFIGLVFCQILVWNIFEIKRPIRTLTFLFFLLPIVGFVGLTIGNVIAPIEVLAALILHLLLSSAYVQNYPSFEEDIPYFRILLLIFESRDKASCEHTFIDCLATPQLLNNKFKGLVNGELIVRNGGQDCLTRAGHFLVGFFSAYRKWLGLEMGNG